MKYTGIEILFAYPRPSTKQAIAVFEEKPIIAVEIGTEKGDNAYDMVRQLNIQMLYVIDPYSAYDDYIRSENTRTEKGMMDIERMAKRKLKKYGEKISWIKKLSNDAVNDIPNNVDFIYIDGNHEYEYVLNDMRNYWAKIRQGGVMAGHDINNSGVAKAVCQFAKENNLYFTAHKMDWMILK